MLTYSEEKLLSANKTSSDYENEFCVHSKLEFQAHLNPGQIALIHGNKKLSYQELNDLSNSLANKLLELQLKTEDFVVVCLDRSIELMVSIYGVLKAGGVYVPIPPSLPQERIKFILGDSAPKVIITTNKIAKDFKSDIQFLYIDDFMESRNHNITPPKANVLSTNLAYLIYTSGTTGNPKGVMIEHHSVMNRIGWMQKAYPINSDDVLIQKTSIAFDVSVWELFWWSFTGSKLVILDSGEEKDPKQIIQQIGQNDVTVIHFVPSMLNEFISYLKSKNIKDELKHLKYIFCSGEALNVQSVKNLYTELAQAGSKAKVVNLYGPTEATVDVTHYLCTGDETSSIPIGKPIDNTQIFIVNENGNVLSNDEKGELLISGVNLARGYLKRPELTSEKFTFINVNGANIRAYKTGDIAYWDSECNLIYLGRNDNQIKLRGYRIELGEIESTLRMIEGIKDCAVLAHNITRSDATLIGFCVVNSKENTTEKSIKTYLKSQLPDYMVPSQFIFLDKIPVTINGKLNKEELLNLIKTKKETQELTHNNNIQQKVYQIWCELLNRNDISVDSNFFDIGGNSLLIVQMTILLRETFQIDIDVFDLFQHTNINSLSGYIKSKLNQ